MNSRKAAPIQPCTASTLARSDAGRLRPNTATSAPKKVRISTHSSIEPSWLPQVPVTLNSSGFSEWEFSQTLATEKSDWT